ncbi:MAG TPA: phosphate signaling complex protein PhoU [Candidatus Saccharimonadales bacterium]|nr:phosphate signaling complex protein PhoU [Candidatus Saccharimonadales bacterium]
MMRSRFQQGLDELKERLLKMGGMAEAAIELAADSYRKRDGRLAQQVFEREKMINESERTIDEMVVDLLAMQQPMATDLRFVLAVLKINSDLERVGDLAVNIAQRSLDLLQESEVEVPVDIARMTAAVSTMVRRALESFLSAKADVAQAVLEMDNIVDRMKDEAFVNLVEQMKNNPDKIRPYMDILLITRSLERIADHATNIAEDVIFWISGADVRHNARFSQEPDADAPRSQ